MGTDRPVELDGTMGEGGGQILRTAVFLSLATARSFRITDIRAGRKKPGLKRQHLGIVKAVVKMTGAYAEGARLASSSLEFEPAPVRGGTVEIDLQTAASIPLFLQTVLPVCLLADRAVRVRVRGGTDVSMSPTLDYVSEVVVPVLRGFAKAIEVKVERRGFHPKGGGVVELRVRPRGDGWRSLELDRFGEVRTLGGISVCSQGILTDRRVAERQRQAAANVLRDVFGRDPRIRCDRADTASPGSSVTLWAEDSFGARLGAAELGVRGVHAEKIGKAAGERLVAEWKEDAAVDRHLADHLIPFLGLVGGTLRTSEVTSHTRTNARVTEMFLGTAISIEGNRIRCEGSRSS